VAGEILRSIDKECQHLLVYHDLAVDLLETVVAQLASRDFYRQRNTVKGSADCCYEPPLLRSNLS
jgi:hypothetical protein